MEEFVMNTRIYMGEDSCGKISGFEIRRAFVFCDPFMRQSGKTDLITAKLEKMHAEYYIFADVVPDPDMTVIQKGLNQLNIFKPDTVFAFGGGSAIDTAKAVVHLYAKMHGIARPQIIAVPTTSGTGSEVTAFAVISDREAGVKYPLIDPEMIPDAVFLDPKLTATVPPAVTADTGMDVLTHGFEAFVSTDANDFTDAMAEKSIRTVWDYLERCVASGDDMDARAHMHNASCMAGMAFNAASLGICHSMAHALGAQFHLPHGRCNALLLPIVIEYNAGLEIPGEPDALQRYLDIARLLGITAGTNKATVHLMVRQIRELMSRIGIPVHFADLNIDADSYLKSIDMMAENALKDRCTVTNPRIPTTEHIKRLYRKLYQS